MENLSESLYEEYLPKIYRYIYNRIPHKQTCEDLTSTVFLKAVSRLDTYKSSQPFGSWIYAIARNTVIDYYRSNKSTLDLETAHELLSDQDVSADADKAIKLESVRKSLGSLKEVHREVMIMRVWDDLSHREIAEILNISEANSKMIFSRAVNELKATVNLGEVL